MKLGIDACNIRMGGGLTHLVELLENGNPCHNGISEIIVWSSDQTLNKLPSRDWLIKRSHPLMNKTFIHSFIFQLFYISTLAKKDGVNLMFVPGGTFLGRFPHIVAMSQNMLPFEKAERSRYPHFFSKLKFFLLKFTQIYTFRKSQGVIFLTHYAKSVINKELGSGVKTAVISHGINPSFLQKPKLQKSMQDFDSNDPFKFLYVSIVTVYKHQWNVAEAILKLREEGWPVSLKLVGTSTAESLQKLNEILAHDQYGCIDYLGLVEYENLAQIYKSADGFIFASSCENQPIILIEAMTAGLPIACSDMGAMPEVLKEAGFYFNPLEVESIYQGLKEFLKNREARQEKSLVGYQSSLDYTWKDCADKTFEFLSQFSK